MNTNSVLCVRDNIHTHYKCYVNGNVPYKDYKHTYNSTYTT